MLDAPALIDEQVLTFEVRKWIGMDWRAPFLIPLGGSGTWRPLTAWVWWLDAGLPVEGRHAVNLVLHAGFVGVAHRWLACRLSPVAACVAACFLAVHPAHVANAGWLAGRADLLMGLAAVGAMWAWERQRWIVAAALGAAAVLFKETGVVVLPILLLLRRDPRLILPAATVLAAFALSWAASIPEPGYRPTFAALSAASSLVVPFTVELFVPWFDPIGVPGVQRDLLGIGAAVPVFAAFLLLGRDLPDWRVGVTIGVLGLAPVLHVIGNDGGQWYLLLGSVGAALAWGALAEALPGKRGTAVAIALLGVCLVAATWEATRWRAASIEVDRIVEDVRCGRAEPPPRQDPRAWPHRGPSFCCGVPYQVLEARPAGWGPIFEDEEVRPPPGRCGPDPE